MTEENKPPHSLRDSLTLKLPEPAVSQERPWDDDLLGRSPIAERLTSLIRHQSSPLVATIHGNWGTGKTFLLKRWQQDLENQGFMAIYFNAWEDDFCDDPLLAILGQMHEYLKGSSTLRSLAEKAARIAVPLIRQNIVSVLEKHTGLTINLDQITQGQPDPLENYQSQRATKDQLKKRLTEISGKVREETGYPMVFIIDELDRCRPTFAVELLERVKHIFDVQDLVFILGINRDELCSSLQSIYGAINADVYLRRFFDIEFTLPDANTSEFSTCLMQRFGLQDFFVSLTQQANHRVHQDEYAVMANSFPMIWSYHDLSLRDIDSCIRLISLVGRSLGPGSPTYPWLIGILIPLKLKNLPLYRRFMQGSCPASQVMNYLDALLPLADRGRDFDRGMNLIEAALYRTRKRMPHSQQQGSTPAEQLQRLYNGAELEYPDYLSERTKKSDAVRVGHLLELVSAQRGFPEDNVIDLDYIAGLIDLSQPS